MATGDRIYLEAGSTDKLLLESGASDTLLLEAAVGPTHSITPVPRKPAHKLILPEYSDPATNLILMGDATSDLAGSANFSTNSKENIQIVDGRAVKRFTGSSNDLTNTTTNLINTSDFFHIWALIKPGELTASRRVYSRGRDGFGNGWSVLMTLNSTGSVSIDVVMTAVGTTAYYNGSTEKVVEGEWNFVGASILQKPSVEPSFTKVHVNGVSKRKGLTGNRSLRTSTIEDEIGSYNGSYLDNTDMALFGLRVVPDTMTEAESDAVMEDTYRETMAYVEARRKYWVVSAPITQLAALNNKRISSMHFQRFWEPTALGE